MGNPKNNNVDTKKIENDTPREQKYFGWRHLLFRVIVIALVASILSYLQVIGVINVSSGVEAQLLVPATIGFLLAILNFRLLLKIAIVLLPLWFATGIAIEFAGVIAVQMLKNGGLEVDLDGILGLVLKYLPAAISGHWLYSGYSRFSRNQSILVYILVVIFSILVAFLIYTDFNIYIVEAIYLIVVSTLLSYMHLGKIMQLPSRKKK